MDDYLVNCVVFNLRENNETVRQQIFVFLTGNLVFSEKDHLITIINEVLKQPLDKFKQDSLFIFKSLKSIGERNSKLVTENFELIFHIKP